MDEVIHVFLRCRDGRAAFHYQGHVKISHVNGVSFPVTDRVRNLIYEQYNLLCLGLRVVLSRERIS